MGNYYNLVFAIPSTNLLLVLHPRLKLSYFKTAHWKDEWIKTTEKVVRNEFEHSYMTDALDDITVIDDVTPDSHQNLKACFHLYLVLYLLTYVLTSPAMYSTAYPCLPLPNLLTKDPNSTIISVQKSNTSPIQLHGGMSSVAPTHVSRAWPWTI